MIILIFLFQFVTLSCMVQENTILPLQSELRKLPFEISENIYKNLNVNDLLKTRLVSSTINDEIKSFFNYSLKLSNIHIFTNYALQKSLWQVLKFHEIEKMFLPDRVIADRINKIFLPGITDCKLTKESSIINLFLEPDLKIINLFNAHPFDFTRKDNTNAESHEIIQNKYQYIFLQNDAQGKENLKPLFKYIKENIENKTYKKSYTFIPETITSQINKYKKYLEYQPKTFIIPASLITTYNQSFVRIPDFIITYQKNITVSKHKEMMEEKVLSHTLVHIDEERPNYVIASILILSFNEILFDKKTVKDKLVCIRDHICNELKTKYKTKKIFLKVNYKYYSLKTPFLEIFQDYSDDQVTISCAFIGKKVNANILSNFAKVGNNSYSYYDFFRTWFKSKKNKNLLQCILENTDFDSNRLYALLAENRSNDFDQYILNLTLNRPDCHLPVLNGLFDKKSTSFARYFLSLESLLDHNVKKEFIKKIIENIDPERDLAILGDDSLSAYLNAMNYKDFNFSESTRNRIKQRSLHKDNFKHIPMLCFQYFVDHAEKYNDKEKEQVLINLVDISAFRKLTKANVLSITKKFITDNTLFIDLVQLIRNDNDDYRLLLIACIQEALFQQGGECLLDSYLSKHHKNDLSNAQYRVIDKVFSAINHGSKEEFYKMPDASLQYIFFHFLYSKNTEKYRKYLHSQSETNKYWSPRTLLQSTAEQVLSQLIQRRDNFSKEIQHNIIEIILTKPLLEDSQSVYIGLLNSSFNKFILDLLTQHPALYNTVLEILLDKNPVHFSKYFLTFEPKLDQEIKHDFIKRIVLLNDLDIRQLIYTEQLKNYFKTVNWEPFKFTDQQQATIRQHSLAELYFFTQVPSLYFSYFVNSTNREILESFFIINSPIMMFNSYLRQILFEQILFEKNGHVLLDVFFDVLLKNYSKKDDLETFQYSLKKLLEHIYDIRNQKNKKITREALLSLYKFLSQNTEKIDLYANVTTHKIEYIYSQTREKLIEKIGEFSKNDQECIAEIYTDNAKNPVDPEKINEFFLRHINLFGDRFKEKWYAFLNKNTERLNFFKSNIAYYISLHETDIKKLIELYTQFDLEKAKKIHSNIQEIFRSFYDKDYDNILLRIFNAYDTQDINNADIEMTFNNWLVTIRKFRHQFIKVFINKPKLFLYFITITSQKEPKTIGLIAQDFYKGLCNYQKNGGKDSQINARSMEISSLINVLMDPNTSVPFSFIDPFIATDSIFKPKANQIFSNIIQNQPVTLFLEYFQHRELFLYINRTAELKNQLFKKIETIGQLSVYLAHIKNIHVFIQTIDSFLENHKELLHTDFFKELYLFLQNTTKNDFLADYSGQEVIVRSMLQHYEQLKSSEQWNFKQFYDFTLPLVEKLVSTLVDKISLSATIVDYVIKVFDSTESWNYYIREYHPLHNDQKEIPIIIDFLRKNADKFFKTEYSGSGKVINNKQLDMTMTIVPFDCVKSFIKTCIENKHINFINDFRNDEFKKILCSNIRDYFTAIQTHELDIEHTKQLIMLYRKTLPEEDIKLNCFTWFIEKYIVKFHQESTSKLFEDLHYNMQLLKEEKWQSDLFYNVLSQACDSLKQQQSELFYSELAEALNHFNISKESMLFSYTVKYMDDEEFIDKVCMHFSDFFENKTAVELVDILCNMQRHQEILPLQKRFIDQLYIRSDVLSDCKNYKEFIRQISEILKKWDNEEKKDSLFVNILCNMHWHEEILPLQKKFVDQLYAQSNLLSWTENHKKFTEQILEILKPWDNEEKKDPLFVNILCNMHWHDEILPLQKEFIDHLCIQPNLLLSFENYKGFIEQILEVLKTPNSELKKQSLKSFLQHCGKPTFWHYFLEVFLTSEKLIFSQMKELLTTSLMKNDCFISQFQQPETMEHATPNMFRAFIIHCPRKKLHRMLQLIKKCDSEHIKVTDSEIDLDKTIKSITQKSENLENAIKYYPQVIPQFFKQQCTIAMLKTLKTAIQARKIENSIAVPLLHDLKNRTKNPIKLYFIQKCLDKIDPPNRIALKTLWFVSVLLLTWHAMVDSNIISSQSNFFIELPDRVIFCLLLISLLGMLE